MQRRPEDRGRLPRPRAAQEHEVAGGGRFRGVVFAMTVAPALGLAATIGLLSAPVAGPGGFLAGLLVAPMTAWWYARVHGMTFERTCALVVLGLTAAAVVLAMLVAIMAILYGAAMSDF
jgi:hypothetical protein